MIWLILWLLCGILGYWLLIQSFLVDTNSKEHKVTSDDLWLLLLVLAGPLCLILCTVMFLHCKCKTKALFTIKRRL